MNNETPGDYEALAAQMLPDGVWERQGKTG